MADYTLINLDELENMAAKFGKTGYEARFATKPLELQESGLGYQKLEPGHRLDFGHKHEVQEEVFIVLSGSGRAKLGEEIIEIKKMDAIRIPKDTMRGFQAGPDGMDLLIVGAPHTEKNDAILERGWWQ
jgi:mannose-6-phosphate isomerase-like protein (cupin superfamily)